MANEDYRNVVWSPMATIPDPSEVPAQLPLPGTADFDLKVNGNRGDLLVVQLRSGQHANHSDRTQKTLRSLGLRGIRSYSLRSSYDHVTTGYIKAVRSYVGVIELGNVKWKTTKYGLESPSEFESNEYGTNTRPAGLVRSSIGDYFAYQSDRNGVLVNWSTDRTFQDCYHALTNFSSVLVPLTSPDASAIALGEARPKVYDAVTISSTSMRPVVLREGPTNEILELLQSSSVAVSFGRLSFRGLDLTWQAPYRRFVDSDREVAEVGLYSRTLDRDLARRFARSTAPRGFIESAHPEVRVRENGNPKRIRF